ncbi:MAG: diacylglycerol kinase family protein [Gemmatimonadota bacterium]|nr:diacylglycerol kinase family protein [Gemmatimonadota bacterium]
MIFNPASGRGRGRRRISRYKRLLERAIPDVRFAATARAGDERDLTERALADGYDVVVAVGGDGTWSNVADRIVASGRSDVAFGVLPSGTGNDFGRNLGFRPDDAAEAVRALAGGTIRHVDVGRLETPSASEHHPDRFEARHFLNLVGFGFDIAVIDAAARARFLRGELLYKATALGELFRFPGTDIRIETGSGSVREGRYLMLTISNGCYFGGGFPIAPGATVDDGKLHGCRIVDAGPLERLRLFNRAGKGRHLGSEGVEVLDDDRFTVTFASPPRFEMDGEVRVAAESTLEVTIMPGALPVIVPANAEVPAGAEPRSG